MGFFANAKENGFSPEDKKIVLIGAGGAARSIAAQALFENIREIAIYNRTFDNARKLVSDLSEEAKKRKITIRAEALADKEKLQQDIKEADLVINATSVGMNPESNEIIINPDWLTEGTVTADIVYTPVETRLESEARKRGLQTLDGLGMVLWQGAYAFKIWTGKDFPVEIVKEKVFELS